MFENENDRSQYEYHYQYHQQEEAAQQPPVDIMPAKKRNRRGLRITAYVLAGVLLIGGSYWAGTQWQHSVRQKTQETQISQSDRQPVEVQTVSVTGGEKLTYSQVYAQNVESCVSINVSSVGYNYFGQPTQTASSGSGFVITADGYIVTNYHVISGGTGVEVTMNDGVTYTAEIIGSDEEYDIAVLKIQPGEKELRPVVLGSSDTLLVGDDVLAIGNPLGELTFSLSEGIVSCLNREINVDGTPFTMIQTTAAVNSGNSGGPLFNLYGEVVGIVSAKYSTSSSGTTVEGLGFAIPMEDVVELIRDIMENGQVTTKPYMGVYVANASDYPRCGMKAGAYLVEVTEDGPAALAGLQAGDVITMLDQTIISSRDDLTDALGSKSHQAGDVVTVTFVRNGEVQTTSLTLGSTLDKPETEETQETESQQQQQQQQQPYSYGYGSMQDFLERYFGYSQQTPGNQT